jgi:hypothetical protein
MPNLTYNGSNPKGPQRQVEIKKALWLDKNLQPFRADLVVPLCINPFCRTELVPDLDCMKEYQS